MHAISNRNLITPQIEFKNNINAIPVPVKINKIAIRYKLKNRISWLLFLGIFIIIGCEILLNLTPPINRDTLVHHLAIPKLWVQNGIFFDTSWAVYSYYPMYINLLYVICLYFKSDIAPKIIHLFFGISIGILIYHYIKSKYDHYWGLLGLLIFISTPIVIWLSTSAYIDLGMSFFTTASLLCLIKWLDSDFNYFKWFFLSAACMGVAVGSKYNAMIAFVISNFLLIFLYARHTQKQIDSLKWGVFYAIIVMIIASPWYLKNYLLTNNPIYPLLNGFFHSTILNQTDCGLPDKKGAIGIFQLRELLYGETLWEVLLIPIRMFFQGDDYGYQYFQGVLNPILIIFTPFVFIYNKYKKDSFIFITFATLFIALAFFTTRQQVRYLLPIFPFLTILAIMGIVNLIQWFNKFQNVLLAPNLYIICMFFKNTIYIAIVILISFNFIYLQKRMNIIKPLPYLLGAELKNDFLRRHLSYFPAVEYVNANLPKKALIYTIFLGCQGYYFNKNYKSTASFGMDILSCLVHKAENEEEMRRYIQKLGATHILWKTSLVQKYLADNFDHKMINRLSQLIRSNWLLLYNDGKYAVFDLQTLM